VVCGTAGVGKTTVALEVSLLLAAKDVAHALIDGDELDRVHPWPPPGWAPSELSRRNLAAVWANYAELGHTRLILAGVYTDLAVELEWIRAVVGPGRLTVFRLSAEDAVLAERVRRREIGSGADDQLRRTLAYASEIADPPDVVQIDTTELAVPAAALLIFERLGWGG
jgi:hypothetical protein